MATRAAARQEGADLEIEEALGRLALGAFTQHLWRAGCSCGRAG